MRTKCRGTQLAVDPDPAGGYKPRMARKARTPSYCHHKPRNLGYARLPDPDRPGRYVTVYFPGRYDSPESLGAYHAAIAEWRRTGRPPDLPRPAGDRRESLAVLELVDRFWDHVEQHGLYRKNGRPTSEIGCLRLAFRELLALRVRGRPVDTLPVAEFGVAEIDALRAAMVAKGWAARSIRIHLTRVRSLLRWGKSRGLVPADVIAAIDPKAQSGLGTGRQHAAGRQPPKVRPPEPAAVGAVLAAACPPARCMILLQRLNGIRSGGLVAMTPRQFERVGDLLLYTEPEEVAAKTGRERHWLGPLAQAELKPFLDAAAAVGPDELLFRPAIRPRRAVAGYTVIYFGQYIARLCAKLGVEHWHPHQLRHEHLTKVRRLYGPDAARARASHANLSTTEIYAEADDDLARRVAREIG
jgi:integrase